MTFRDVEAIPELLNEKAVLTPVRELTAHPQNPRQGDVGAITESIRSHGFYGALVVQRSTNRVLVGNHRLQAAIAAGLDAVPVFFVDVDDDRALRILLADNRTNDLASYDEPLLADLLKALHDSSGELDGTGYSGDDLDELLAKLDSEPTKFTSSDDEEMPFERVSFTLTTEQVKRLKKALDKVRDEDDGTPEQVEAAALMRLVRWANQAMKNGKG